MGVERSHVVIDEEGRLAEVARKVKPAESATQALAALG
jgi:peroxiredoxin